MAQLKSTAVTGSLEIVGAYYITGSITGSDAKFASLSASAIQGTVVGAAESADKLTTARTISATGDIDWSVTFDGSGNATGTAAIGTGVIVNNDINSSAAIADTKLATISTAGKVSNSATTATSANTNSTIVARDSSGNFSAGTITATLDGNASTATNATTVTNGVYTNTTQTITGQKTFDSTSNQFTGSFSGSGASIVSLNASNISAGTLASARLPDLAVSDFGGSAIQTSAEGFSDSDTVLMTAAAVADKIESYGYGIGSGDITSVNAGTGLTGGATSGDATLAIDTTVVPRLSVANVFSNSSNQFTGSFKGDLDGTVSTATNATNVYTTTDYTTNATRFIPFVTNLSSQNQALLIDGGISYNPSTNTVAASIFSSTGRSALKDLAVDTDLLYSDSSNKIIKIGDADTASGTAATLRIKCGSDRNDGIQLFRNDSNSQRWYIWQKASSNELYFQQYNTTSTKAIHFTQNADIYLSGSIYGAAGSTFNGTSSYATSAGSVTNATNATNVYTTTDYTTNATRFIPFVASLGSQNQGMLIDGGLSYNPNSNTLTCGAVSAAVAKTSANYTISSGNTQYIGANASQLSTLTIDAAYGNTYLYVIVNYLGTGQTSYVQVTNNKSSNVTLYLYGGATSSASSVSFSTNGGAPSSSKVVNASGGKVTLWYANANGTIIGGTF